jgi:hypothetical protein
MAGKRRKRKCLRYRTRKVIQDYGPAKKVRSCASYGRKASKKRRGGKRRATKRGKWCVFRGRGKAAQMQTCHKNKRMAKHAAAVLRRTCRAKVRIKKVKGA